MLLYRGAEHEEHCIGLERSKHSNASHFFYPARTVMKFTNKALEKNDA